MTVLNQPPFAHFLGMKIVSVTPDRLEAEILVREEFNNRNGVMHGGAIMGFADNMGGALSHANLKPNQRTTTIESKTNFFAGIPIGDVARATCVPLHRGRTTIVVETRITRGDGKLAAIVIQTQLVMEKKA
jgi:1,4-dihydroxy-2-naphthoyl-CoA hydrolase